MKNTHTVKISLLLLLGLAQTTVHAGEHSTNRFSVSARAGFNIKSDFRYSATTFAGASDTTPNGDAYNYDDGYVLTDVSGNAGGMTWYWGYDDSAAQVDTLNDEIVMTRTDNIADSGKNDMDGSTPFVGAEMLFSHEFERSEDWRFGFDIAASFMPLDFEDDSQFMTTDATTTDRFAFTGGTTPPTATPGTPYQGTFNGPGFLIGSTPASSSTVTAPGAAVNVKSELDGTLWGLRIGPYMEFPLSDSLLLHCSGGLSLGWLDVDVDWQATGAISETGGGRNSANLSGMYLGADLLWLVTENWHLTAGAEFEYLNDWEGDFGAGTASLDFTRTLYATLGIARDF